MVDKAQDLLLICLRIRESADHGSPAALRKLIVHYLGEFENRCREAGHQSASIQDARYALVALLDETVLSTSGPCREQWLAEPLQLALYGEAVAGEEFYRRLERLLADTRVRSDVVEVFLVCLAMGFEGRYRLGGGAKREEVIARACAAIGRDLAGRVATGAPGGSRLERSGGWLGRWGFALGSAAVVGLIWVFLAAGLALDTDASMRAMSRYGAGEAAR